MPKSRGRRKPTKSKPSRAARAAGGGRWFHGGAPGLQPGEVLKPANVLGLSYRYHQGDAPYDPNWVYVTSDEGVARAYASRYVDRFGRRPPGAVYEVEPLDATRPDPDFGECPETHRRCRRAAIKRVAATDVKLSKAEQIRLESPYYVWPEGGRIWDENGLIRPSQQMIGNGVTREWTSMMRPWLSLDDISAEGRLRCVLDAIRTGNWSPVLDVVIELDGRCEIEAATAVGGYRCTRCGTQILDVRSAARHQLGDRVVELIATMHPISREPLLELALAARQRNPQRWLWLAERTLDSPPTSGPTRSRGQPTLGSTGISSRPRLAGLTPAAERLAETARGDDAPGLWRRLLQALVRSR